MKLMQDVMNSKMEFVLNVHLDFTLVLLEIVKLFLQLAAPSIQTMKDVKLATLDMV